ncbi:MAG TPA: YlbF family regulator [Halanaerobiales bacterium]|nr:YlbF family regulator [Halanaerobiales bacterium]
MSVIEKAKELGQELVESEEYKELKRKEKALYDDEDATSLLEEYENINKQLQMARANGQEVNDQQQKKMQSLQMKMEQNPSIKSYIESQKKFNEVMNSVNKIINGYITEQEQEQEAAQDQGSSNIIT